MTTQLRTPATGGPDTDESRAAECSACGHPLRDHDEIGRRYCAASQVNALSRRCICSPPRG
jgi:hypothetical protein